MAADLTPCYVGRKPCGCAVFAVVDDPKHAKDTAREIAAAIRDGLAIERSTVEEVRSSLVFGRCPHHPPPEPKR